GDGRPLLPADGAAASWQPPLSARGRCRSARNGGPPPARGDGRQASARRARRAIARQGAAFADAPARAVPPSFSVQAVVPVIIAAARARTTGFRHFRANRAGGLTRGGGPVAVRRSGGLWPARTSAMGAAPRVACSI